MPRIARAGYKDWGRCDLTYVELAEGTSVAGVFTLNAFCAAPVILAKKRVSGSVRYLLTNTGNANAGTGEAGLHNAMRACASGSSVPLSAARLMIACASG